ncbi:MAG: M24 family metallopeptidase [Comamonadaceae bacterium]|nr:M24 family metallopeptidase [Comamonadaceae bacterium]
MSHRHQDPRRHREACASPAAWPAEVLDFIAPYVKPGVTTGELDRLCHDYMVNVQGTHPGAARTTRRRATRPIPSRSAPRSTIRSATASRATRPLKNGDIVNIDITVIKDGWHGDTSRMFVVGEASIAGPAPVRGHLRVRCGRASRRCSPGARLGDIGHAIQTLRRERTASRVVREFCGHGIGRKFHEEPQVLHYGRPGHGCELEPGMIFTIEPMINAGRRDDPRAAPTAGPSSPRTAALSAQWEHTVLVTETGYEVLTAVGRQPAAAGLRAAATPARDAVRGRRPPIAARRPDARVDASRAARVRDGKAALIAHFRAARPRRRGALLRGAGAPRRRHAAPTLWRSRACRRRSRWSPSAATAAASCSRTPTSTC